MINDYFLRNVRQDDMQAVFQLSNEPYVRQYSINSNEIKWEEHVFWFEGFLSSKDTVFYVVTDKTDVFLGQIRYKIQKNIAVISIGLSKSITGKGLSVPLVAESIQRIRTEKPELDVIVAYIAHENLASKKLFEKANFRLEGTEDGMLKYCYSMK